MIYSMLIKGKNTMKKKKILKFGILFFIMIIFIFGIPIVINELYKINSGYKTLWNTADVLSYYGAILQGTCSMAALYITISYTRKQIKFEHFESIENEKIKNIEQVFSNFVEVLYPLKLFKIKLLYGNEERCTDKFLKELLLYQVDLKMTSNKMKCFTNFDQYSYMLNLLDELLELSSILIEYADSLYICYNKIRSAKDKNEKETKSVYKDIDIICDNLQVLTNINYQNILDSKKKAFFQLEKNLESDLLQIIDT